MKTWAQVGSPSLIPRGKRGADAKAKGSLHAHRTAGGHRHYCHSGRDAAPGAAECQSQGPWVICLSNTKQLALGWQLYATDNQERCVNHRPWANTLNWVNNNMSWGLDADNTNTTFIVTSLLGKYTLNFNL